jgi:hypothetical protein
MNIAAITGHTKGIGKCVFDRLSPNIIGFSKSTGYITEEQAVDIILS